MENARKSLYLIGMTLSQVHIQRVHFEPEAPVLIDLVMPNARTNMETCNAKRVYSLNYISEAGDCVPLTQLLAYFRNIDCKGRLFLVRHVII